MFLLQVVFYGEPVLLTPAWVSYVPQAQIAGRRISLLHTSKERGFHLMAAELETHCCAVIEGVRRVAAWAEGLSDE